NTRDNTHWEIMHRIVCWGVKANVHRGGPTGQLVNAVGWLCWNGVAKGERFLFQDRYGVQARKGHNWQGHYGQFLAMLAQSGVQKSYQLKVDGKTYTVGNLVESEMKSCRGDIDMTFKLIGLAYYLRDTDATWRNNQGEVWDMERVMRREIAAPILNDAPCGGTHRLMSLSYAIKARQRDGKPLTGEFSRAERYIQDYHRYALALQNPDGSFSTEWFRRRAAKNDLDRRLQTTGHILEWLVFSLDDEELTQPRVVKAVQYLNNALWSQRYKKWEIGPLGHALHALMLYEQRVFSKLDRATAQQPATQPSGQAAYPRTASRPATGVRPVNLQR
ncbi:MAG: hypothetical protein N2C14_19260, partial [Planctomycetales bacterium]